jgi:hypothetical protein
MADPKQVYRARPTPDEIAEVLAKRLVATVGTLNEDGSIHLAYVIFLHHEGRMYFETSSLTRKARNAERRGWASMIVQGQASTGRSLMVAGEDTAKVLRGPEAHDLNHRLRAKYIKPAALDDIDRAPQSTRGPAPGGSPRAGAAAVVATACRTPRRAPRPRTPPTRRA